VAEGKDLIVVISSEAARYTEVRDDYESAIATNANGPGCASSGR
jgi:hypothetical protein